MDKFKGMAGRKSSASPDGGGPGKDEEPQAEEEEEEEEEEEAKRKSKTKTTTKTKTIEKKRKKVNKGPGLRHLDLTDCDRLTDRSLAALGHCVRLESPVLVGVNSITDSGMLTLGNSAASSSPASINISGCFAVSNAGLNTHYGICRLSSKAFRKHRLSSCRGST